MRLWGSSAKELFTWRSCFLADPNNVATSVSSQINLALQKIYHYVVLKGKFTAHADCVESSRLTLIPTVAWFSLTFKRNGGREFLFLKFWKKNWEKNWKKNWKKIENSENFEFHRWLQYYSLLLLLASGKTEIGLMDSTFTTLYQSSTGFLSGQSTIVQMTAIQIIQDQQGVNPDMLAVFGTGADGLGYVGFVTMLLTADPTLPIAPFSVRKLSNYSNQGDKDEVNGGMTACSHL
jgi:hypothetical protein